MSTLRIMDYRPEHQPHFERLNRAWIEKFFWLEEIDLFVLQQPETALLQPGGAILMAAWNGTVAGTVALKKVDSHTYELTKMAVDEDFRRKGIAEALSRAAFKKAKELGACTVILYSQTSLAGAIALYRKLGFREVPIEKGVYKRSDIKMEIDLSLINI